MKIDLDKKDLIHLVIGIKPPLHLFDILEHDKLGKRQDSLSTETEVFGMDWNWDSEALEKMPAEYLWDLYQTVKKTWATITEHLGKSSKYYYEINFDEEEDEAFPIKGWIPISKEMIKDPTQVKHYLETGLLRRIKK